MRLDIYFAETANIAREQTAMPDEARQALSAGRPLSRLERNGVLHAFQVLVEKAIGMAKHLLKDRGEPLPTASALASVSGGPLPVSGYDSFSALCRSGILQPSDLESWNRFIGLRNRIVHDYMNLDMERVLDLVRSEGYHFGNFSIIPGKKGGFSEVGYFRHSREGGNPA